MEILNHSPESVMNWIRVIKVQLNPTKTEVLFVGGVALGGGDHFVLLPRPVLHVDSGSICGMRMSQFLNVHTSSQSILGQRT